MIPNAYIKLDGVLVHYQRFHGNNVKFFVQPMLYKNIYLVIIKCTCYEDLIKQ